jgi:hypothetical protein
MTGVKGTRPLLRPRFPGSVPRGTWERNPLASKLPGPAESGSTEADKWG